MVWQRPVEQASTVLCGSSLDRESTTVSASTTAIRHDSLLVKVGTLSRTQISQYKSNCHFACVLHFHDGFHPPGTIEPSPHRMPACLAPVSICYIHVNRGCIHSPHPLATLGLHGPHITPRCCAGQQPAVMFIEPLSRSCRDYKLAGAAHSDTTQRLRRR